MTNMNKPFAVLTIFICILTSCEKDSGFGLEIYLLKDFKTKSPSQEIIPGSEKLYQNPIINYQNIVFYDSTAHFFKIDSLKAVEFNHKAWPTQGTAFALTIDRTIIYSGYFIPGYSSSGSDWISIDPLSINGKIRVTLGYPGDQQKLLNIDPRNDERIISFLKADNKLSN
jgi:hypothetical protein